MATESRCLCESSDCLQDFRTLDRATGFVTMLLLIEVVVVILARLSMMALMLGRSQRGIQVFLIDQGCMFRERI